MPLHFSSSTKFVIVIYGLVFSHFHFQGAKVRISEHNTKGKRVFLFIVERK